MKYIKLLIFSFFTLALSNLFAQNVIFDGKSYLYGDRIVVKFKDLSMNKSASLPAAMSKTLQKFGIEKVEKRFHLKESIQKADIPLNKVAVLKYSSPMNPKFLAQKISKLKGVEWAEPYYLDQIMYTPNDPDFSVQWHLAKIQAELAWDINKGDSSIIVAINDTGVDWDHPDLAANIWTNSNEIPDNGIDDDNNGFIDDIRGWDFGGINGTPDNNPMEDRSDHGTHVAGLVSAVTDNGIGIASIGFNTTIMPVKTSRDDVRDNNGNALISNGYDGIIYAVDNGAKVINCSWGSYSYSTAAQMVIDYAVDHGVLLVGAAGNENLPEVIYPGGYNGALSVGATTSTDTKASFSNYGKYVEVMAPGHGLWATWQNDTYASLSGTSMASPVVAGIAALVYSQFPSYNPLQVAEQIRATCDNIDSVNSSRVGLLGSGRVNAYKALSTTDAKSVRLQSVQFTDEGDGDGILEPGETVSVYAEFFNYLSPLSSLMITMESKSSNATVTNGSFNAGAVATLESFNNAKSLFTFTISETCPENEELEFLFSYSETGLSGFDWTNVLANPTYRTQAGNKIAVTLTSKGTIGFNDYPNNLQGDGFSFDNSANLLFEGALMYGTSRNSVVNAARDATGNNQDADFSVIKPFVLSVPGTDADQQGLSVFNDNNAGGGKLGIETEMHSYSYANTPDDNYLILRYKFKNKSGSDINGFRAGLYFDWDMDESDYADNVTRFDQTGGFGYVFNSDLNPVSMYITCAMISSSGFYSFYGIENDGATGGISVYDGFTDIEKWETLSSGTSNTDAGPNDISFVAGGGPVNIAADDSVEFAFAIAGGYSLDELRTAVQNAKLKYDDIVTSVKKGDKEIPLEFSLSQNYPNPFNPTTKIKFSIPNDKENINGEMAKLTVYNILGSRVATLLNKRMTPGNYEVIFNAKDLPSGVYIYKLEWGYRSSTKKMILLK